MSRFGRLAGDDRTPGNRVDWPSPLRGTPICARAPSCPSSSNAAAALTRRRTRMLGSASPRPSEPAPGSTSRSGRSAPALWTTPIPLRLLRRHLPQRTTSTAAKVTSMAAVVTTRWPLKADVRSSARCRRQRGETFWRGLPAALERDTSLDWMRARGWRLSEGELPEASAKPAEVAGTTVRPRECLRLR